MSVTGINPTTGPVRHGNLHIAAPPGAGTGALDQEKYFITNNESNLPVLETVLSTYSGRFDDVTYYN